MRFEGGRKVGGEDFLGEWGCELLKKRPVFVKTDVF